MTRLNRLAKEVSWVLVGQLASIIASLVLVRVLTENLNPTQYGQLALGLTVASFVNQVVVGGVINGIVRYYSIALEKQDLNGYLLASLRMLLYASLVTVGVGLFALGALVLTGNTDWIAITATAFLFAILVGYNSAMSGIQNAARQRVIVTIYSAADAWLKILIVTFILSWLGSSSTLVIVGYSCSALVIVAAQSFFLRKNIRVQKRCLSTNNEWIGNIWKYSLPFSAFGLFTWMQLASDRWALQTYSAASDVGQYAVLYQLGYTPVALAIGFAMNFLSPILYQRSGDATDALRNRKVHQLVWKMAYLALAATLLCFCFVYYTHEWLYRLLVASEYRTTSYLLPWIVLGGGVFAAGQMLALKIMSDMKPAIMIKAKIVTGIVAVIGNILGAIFYGIQGVVGAVVLFCIFYFIWMAILAKNQAVVP